MQQSGLPGARFAHQRQHLAALHIQVDARRTPPGRPRPTGRPWRRCGRECRDRTSRIYDSASAGKQGDRSQKAEVGSRKQTRARLRSRAPPLQEGMPGFSRLRRRPGRSIPSRLLKAAQAASSWSSREARRRSNRRSTCCFGCPMRRASSALVTRAACTSSYNTTQL